ncbi:MAG: DUF2237 family protein [Bacteroidetes bacterium]|nr:MAG: DUF2237 family protein [Bacteroidota bacterium]
MKNNRLSLVVTIVAVFWVLFLYWRPGKNAALPFPESVTPKNVLGTPLQVCSVEPMTGFLRKGTCQTNANDACRHIVCAEMTEAFLTYTKSLGNDLTVSKKGFPGLKPGDYWCLCVSRWIEALHEGVAPPVLLHATPEEVLDYVPAETLKREAVYTKEF